MKELFWVMVGLVIGTVFHADIPVLNKISASKIKGIIDSVTESVTEEPSPPTKKEIRQKKKKNRKDKDIINTVEM